MMQKLADLKDLQTGPASERGRDSPSELSETNQRHDANKLQSTENKWKNKVEEPCFKENEPSQSVQQADLQKPVGATSGFMGGFCCQAQDVTIPTKKQHRNRKSKKSDAILDQQDATLPDNSEPPKTKLKRKPRPRPIEETKSNGNHK